jgi:hypothetical protein
MSAADRRVFDRWLKANLVVASITAFGFLALAGSNAWGPNMAIAESPQPALVSDQAPPSPFEIMSRLAPGELPVQQVNEPF